MNTHPITKKRKKHGGSHALALAVEKQLPGEKVIAGPFEVNHASLLVAKEERGLATKALKQQKKGRVVMFRDRAFIVRPTAGWQRQGKDGGPKQAKPVILPLAGEIWQHAELGPVRVTSVTRDSVDYRVEQAKEGHRNKVGPLGWFVREFVKEGQA